MPNKKGFLSEPVGRVLLRMSVSNSFGALAAASFALVDTYVVGLLGTQPLTAINFTHAVTLLIMSLAVGLGTSLSTLLARYVGANDPQRARIFLQHGLLGSTLALSALALLCFYSHNTLFKCLGVPADITPFVDDYMYPWYLAVPILTVVILLQQTLRSLGDAKTSAMITLAAALLNAVLDVVFVHGVAGIQGYGIQGATYASLASWSVCFIALATVLRHKHDILHLPRICEFSLAQFQKNWHRLIQVARPASLTLLINPITQSIVLAWIARASPYAVAAYGTGLKIQSLCIIGVTAVSAALMPFLSQNLGAKQPKRAYQGLQQTIKWMFFWHILLFIPLHLYSREIAMWFTQEPHVVNWLHYYLHWLTLGYAPLALIILIANAFIAYQKPMQSMMINMMRSLGLTIPLTWLGLNFLGIQGAFLAPLCANVLMGFVCYKMLARLKPSQVLQESTR